MNNETHILVIFDQFCYPRTDLMSAVDLLEFYQCIRVLYLFQGFYRTYISKIWSTIPRYVQNHKHASIHIYDDKQ